MGTTPQKVHDILKISQEPVSLESRWATPSMPTSPTSSKTRGPWPRSRLWERSCSAKRSARILSTLTPRERKVIELRFGLKR